MSKHTNIEWCDSTVNTWIGCTKVSPACDHCYAEKTTASRALGVVWGPGAPRHRTSAANWRKPLQWNNEPFWSCVGCSWRGVQKDMGQRDDGYGAWIACPDCYGGRFASARRRVFCLSLGDVADNQVDPAWRVDLLKMIADTPNIDWLLLTKRIGILESLLDDALGELSHGLTRWRDAPWPNVWIGATITSQAEADRDIPKLLAMPAARRFVSMEPLLGPVDLEPWLMRSWPNCDSGFEQGSQMETGYCGRCAGHISDPIHTDPERALDWVIVGGESGAQPRPMHPQWPSDLRAQCQRAGVPYLFKQWGEFAPADLANIDMARAHRFVELDGTDSTGWTIDRHTASTAHMVRIGKKVAGRLLDGTEHNGFPSSAVA